MPVPPLDQAYSSDGTWSHRDATVGTGLAPGLGMAVFGALAVGAVILCVVLTRGATFEADEWTWVLQRRSGSLSTLLDSWNGHFSLVPVLVYKVLWATAGLRTYVPYRVIITALHVGCGALVFVYARRRIGDLLGATAAGLILFFGPGWQEFLWPFQLAWLISITTGVGALLALDRRDRFGAATACALLCCSVASSGPGVAVLAGVIAELALRPDRRRTWWVGAVPLGIYVVWWVTYQTTTVTGYAVRHTPEFVLHMLAATFSALTGLYDAHPGAAGWGPIIGVALALGAALAAAWRLSRAGHIWPRAAGLIAIIVLYAIAVAVSRGALSSGGDSRYLYVAAVFVVLAAVELGRGAHPSPGARALLVVLAAAVIVSNIEAERTAGAYLRHEGALVRADLAALDIAGARTAPGYVAGRFPGWPFIILRAGAYDALRRTLGTPAATPATLVALPDLARATADAELIGSERIVLGPATVSPARCRRLTAALEMALPTAGVRIASETGPTVVALRRFARAFTTLGVVAPATSRALSAPHDGARLPWYVRITTRGAARVCGPP